MLVSNKTAAELLGIELHDFETLVSAGRIKPYAGGTEFLEEHLCAVRDCGQDLRVLARSLRRPLPTLDDLLHTANFAYPDAAIEECVADGGAHGDTLAEFIVAEIRETFEPEYPEASAMAIRRAADELQAVAEALENRTYRAPAPAADPYADAFAVLHSSHGDVFVDALGNVLGIELFSDDENPLAWTEPDGTRREIFGFDLDHPGMYDDINNRYEYDILEVPAYCNDGYLDPAIWPMGINPDNPDQVKTPEYWNPELNPRVLYG
jgi:hypothetical protein